MEVLPPCIAIDMCKKAEESDLLVILPLRPCYCPNHCLHQPCSYPGHSPKSVEGNWDEPVTSPSTVCPVLLHLDCLVRGVTFCHATKFGLAKEQNCGGLVYFSLLFRAQSCTHIVSLQSQLECSSNSSSWPMHHQTPSNQKLISSFLSPRSLAETK